MNAPAAALLSPDLRLRYADILRTRLRLILALCEQLLSGVYGPLTDEQASMLQLIPREGEALAEALADLLELPADTGGSQIGR
jgi:hypothetical protein